MSDKLVFLDIETTGLDPQRHEILEVGMVVRTDGQVGSDKNIHFSLGIDPWAAEEKALEVNRYYERQSELQNLLISDEWAERWLRSTLSEAVVIGNNPQFDLRFIEAFFLTHSRVQDSTPWYYHPIDLKALVAGRLGMGEPPWSTKAIARESGVAIPDDAHSALADATWNRDCYDSVFNYKATRCTCGVEIPRRSS